MARPWFLLQQSTINHHVFYAPVYVPGIVEFLLLLRNPPINLLLDLSKLQLGAEHLVLLGLQGGLSLLQSSLQLLLLALIRGMVR